jgi:hypothetical protein
MVLSLKSKRPYGRTQAKFSPPGTQQFVILAKARIQIVIPAKAGIQSKLLDPGSRPE